MKATDYIVDFLVKKGVDKVFGYPGGVICHFIDSITKYSNIEPLVTYNEQGAAFAACGYAQSSHKIGVAFSTSGPGATNLVTGIANAYFDSIPVLFITGQVDTYALNNKQIRQIGFQETNVVDMVKSFSKYAIRIDDPSQISYCLEKAFFLAFDKNPGPVVLDIPADVQRSEIDVKKMKHYNINSTKKNDYSFELVKKELSNCSRPILLAGNGVKLSNQVEEFKKMVEKLDIPVVTSLPAFDILPFDHQNYYGFIGTNGLRYANFVFGKADLVISLGSRLDIRQIGLKRDKYFTNKKLIRFDVDNNQLDYKVLDSELDYQVDVKDAIQLLKSFSLKFHDWNETCKIIKNMLLGHDDCDYNTIYTEISKKIPKSSSITLDVGQNQLFFAQSARLKGQRVFMSSGHGSMGYSLPASIGVYYATKNEVYSFNGDGGLMMNIQELQFIKREKIPIKIICFNNHALGMIRGFQERNFNKNYSLTTEKSGWLSPNFKKIAKAFDIPYIKINCLSEINNLNIDQSGPLFVEIKYNGETNLIPNFGKTNEIQDQIPYIDRELYDKLMSL